MADSDHTQVENTAPLLAQLAAYSASFYLSAKKLGTALLGNDAVRSLSVGPGRDHDLRWRLA